MPKTIPAAGGAMASQVKDLLIAANAAATTNKKRVERLAKLLAAAMQETHGGDWRVQIDHTPEAHFVFVAPRNKPITKPGLEAA